MVQHRYQITADHKIVLYAPAVLSIACTCTREDKDVSIWALTFTAEADIATVYY